jgi:hypothetical protein
VTRTGAALLAALAAISCTSSSEPPAGLGKRLYSGPVRALAPSPDGAHLAFLDGCRDVKAQLLPPQTASCDLRVVSASGGPAPKLAGGVTTLQHGLAWSPEESTLAALAEYDYAAASGTLVLAQDGKARAVSSGVTFHGFGAHGELGFVAGGRLHVLVPGEPAPRAVAGADGVASFDLSPAAFPSCDRADGILVRLLARRTYASGGQLLVSDCRLRDARAHEGGQVGDYGFAPGGRQFAYTVRAGEGSELRLAQAVEGVAARTIARGAQTFQFAPSGAALAFLADAAPGKQGSLHVIEPGRRDALLAPDVGELRWAARAPRLAWLEKYDPRVRAGTLGAGGPGLPARSIAPNVSDFDLSPDGKHLAYLQHTTRGGYSVDLAVADLDAPRDAKPRSIAHGVFGFAFSPDGRWLYYRTRCVRNAEACDLERVPAAGSAPGGKPEAIAPGVKSFEFDPRDPGRLLVTWQRMDMVALDVALWANGKLTRVDTAVLPGSARFLGPDSRRAAYVVAHPKRQGVYVAELPR